MGTGKFIHCKDCGSEWIHYQGIGMNRAYWHCNKCGATKEREIDLDISDTNGGCSCGGLFVLGDPTCRDVICPECQSKNIDLGDEVFDWD